jgi:hypothetical protein
MTSLSKDSFAAIAYEMENGGREALLLKTKARIEIFTRRNSIVTLPKGYNRDPFTANFIWFFGRWFSDRLRHYTSPHDEAL